MFFKNYRSYKLKSKNVLLLYIITFTWGFVFFLPIMALYFEETLFTATNVALVFSIQAIALVLFEVPTGALADLFGRRNTIIVAKCALLLAIILLYIGGSMTVFIGYAIISSFGRALTSGSDTALIYDSLKEEKKEKHYKQIIATYSSLWPIGAIIGSVIGGYLATFSLKLPIFLTIIPAIIGLVLALFLVEPKFTPENHRNIFTHIINTIKKYSRNRQILVLVISGFIVWAVGESAHLLKPLFLEFKMIHLEYFGYVFGATFALSAVGHYFSHTISERIGNKKTIIFAAVLFPLCLILAALTQGIVMITFLVLTAIAFGLRNPIVNHLLNLEVPSKQRATLLSINNLMEHFGVFVAAPFIGYLTDLYTINTAFIISAGVMFSAVPVLVFLKEKN
jgi:MFS family permease